VTESEQSGSEAVKAESTQTRCQHEVGAAPEGRQEMENDLSALEARAKARAAGSGAGAGARAGEAVGGGRASMEARDGNGLVSGKSRSTVG
jgi:hypothetical protein